MSMINQGGPAYPSSIDNYSEKQTTGFNGEAIEPKTFSAYPGMSLRDYFAAKAMQGWSANPIPQDSSIQEVAEWAYRQADAMLAARSQP